LSGKTGFHFADRAFLAIWLPITAFPKLADPQNSGENAVRIPQTRRCLAALLEALARQTRRHLQRAGIGRAGTSRLIGYTTKPLVCPFPDLPPSSAMPAR